MSIQHLGSREVVIRKACRCDGCHLRYPPGTRMKKNANKIDGEFVLTCLCPTCSKVVVESRDDYDEGFEPGSIRDEDPDWEPTRSKYDYPMGEEGE